MATSYFGGVKPTRAWTFAHTFHLSRSYLFAKTPLFKFSSSAHAFEFDLARSSICHKPNINPATLARCLPYGLLPCAMQILWSLLDLHNSSHHHVSALKGDWQHNRSSGHNIFHPTLGSRLLSQYADICALRTLADNVKFNLVFQASIRLPRGLFPEPRRSRRTCMVVTCEVHA